MIQVFQNIIKVSRSKFWVKTRISNVQRPRSEVFEPADCGYCLIVGLFVIFHDKKPVFWMVYELQPPGSRQPAGSHTHSGN